MSYRRSPRPLAGALGALADELSPQTQLAEIQRAWGAAVGPLIAEHARPTAERAGVLTVSCSASVWAQELDLMGPEIVAQLNQALGAAAVQKLRCVAVGH